MTTNHIERLSAALIRPGRVDVRCLLGPATRQQAQQMFASFYRDLPQQHAAAEGTGPLEPAPGAGKAGGSAHEGTPLLVRSTTLQEREAALRELAAEFAAQLPDEPVLSTAQLQAFLMTHRRSPEAAAAAAGAWVQQQLQEHHAGQQQQAGE
jgi:chaperone BCS1